jgi:tetratricopeptide (TPR) repeat protein
MTTALVAVAGVVVIQRLNDDRVYRGLLTDGDRALAAGHVYAAVEAYTGALVLRPDSMVAHYRRGEAYLAGGQEMQAIRDLQEARRLAPEAPEPLAALGELHDRRGEPAIAARWYGLASERLEHADASLLYLLALARYRAGALPDAGEAIRLAVERDDGSPESHYLFALIARDTHRPQEAMAALERAVRLQPSLVDARQELASLYRAAGRSADELAQLNALVALESGRVSRRLALSEALLRAGRHEEALASLAAAEGSTPGDSRVALATGRLHLERAETLDDADAVSEALRVLERALAGTARRSEGMALYARALYLSGHAADAERLLREAIATSPVAPEAFGFLADAAEAQGHPLVARDALLSLDALEGDTVPSQTRAGRVRRIGTLSAMGGDIASAVEFLTLASRMAAPDASLLAQLARALLAMGQLDAARRAVDLALELAPTDAAIRRLAQSVAATSTGDRDDPAALPRRN